MLKKLNTLKVLAILMLFSDGLLAQTTLIPDIHFEEALIDLGIDSGMPDGKVLTANISTLEELSVRGPDNFGGEISDLTGIEDFEKLTFLNCENNKITQLDLSNNLLLDEVNAENNAISSLDISQNALLRMANFSRNQISALDISPNQNLIHFYCFENELTSFDPSQNPGLLKLSLGGNNLTEIDLSKNIKLIQFDCNFNQISALDLSQNMDLEHLVCSGNLLQELDVSKNQQLTNLGCDINELTELNVFENVLLEFLSCSSNKISIINFPPNPMIEGLYCWNNQLIDLDLSGFPKLNDLYCRNNALLCLNVKNGNNLNFKNFSAENNPALECIEVDDPAYSISNWPNVDGGVLFKQFCDNNCSVGTEDLREELQAHLFPNPSRGTIRISFGERIAEGRWILYNSIGQKMQSQTFQNRITLDLEFDQRPGIYFLQVERSDGASKVFKIWRA